LLTHEESYIATSNPKSKSANAVRKSSRTAKRPAKSSVSARTKPAASSSAASKAASSKASAPSPFKQGAVLAMLRRRTCNPADRQEDWVGGGYLDGRHDGRIRISHGSTTLARTSGRGTAPTPSASSTAVQAAIELGDDAPSETLAIGRMIASGKRPHRALYEIESEDSWRRSARSCLRWITSPWRRSLKNGKQIVTLALAICWPLLNPRLCATQSSCRVTICFY
jgi:hypothetical protein